MQLRRSEAAGRLRARLGEYLSAQFELQKYPEEGFRPVPYATELIPASVRRWRDFLARTKIDTHPIFAPWHALVALPEEGFEQAAIAALGRFAESKGASVNPLILGAFTAPPKTRAEVAERYHQVFAKVEQQWKALCEQAKVKGTRSADCARRSRRGSPAAVSVRFRLSDHRAGFADRKYRVVFSNIGL
jgi:hypothetical protein